MYISPRPRDPISNSNLEPRTGSTSRSQLLHLQNREISLPNTQLTALSAHHALSAQPDFVTSSALVSRLCWEFLIGSPKTGPQFALLLLCSIFRHSTNPPADLWFELRLSEPLNRGPSVLETCSIEQQLDERRGKHGMERRDILRSSNRGCALCAGEESLDYNCTRKQNEPEGARSIALQCGTR
jgi:hypothetical protein